MTVTESTANKVLHLKDVSDKVNWAKRAVRQQTHTVHNMRFETLWILAMGFANAFYSIGEQLQNTDKNQKDAFLREAIDVCFSSQMKSDKEAWLRRLMRGEMVHQGVYRGLAWLDYEEWWSPEYRLGFGQVGGDRLTAEEYLKTVGEAFDWWNDQLVKIRATYLKIGGIEANVWDLGHGRI